MSSFKLLEGQTLKCGNIFGVIHLSHVFVPKLKFDKAVDTEKNFLTLIFCRTSGNFALRFITFASGNRNICQVNGGRCLDITEFLENRKG